MDAVNVDEAFNLLTQAVYERLESQGMVFPRSHNNSPNTVNHSISNISSGSAGGGGTAAGSKMGPRGSGSGTVTGTSLNESKTTGSKGCCTG